ncbi:conserved hypothetical protein [Ricinus communis]|uniref:Transmembrane protein n=1 Tax=Ricinus communis TaxID=3988 RepID=B9RKU7_RICCO|nr:conserved hypothetical protein [Ricinus communis]
MDNPPEIQLVSQQLLPTDLEIQAEAQQPGNDPEQQLDVIQIEMQPLDNSQQPLLANHSPVNVASADYSQRRQDQIGNEIKDLKTKIVDIDKRLQELQSRSFQLANIYFVFQGVISTIVLTSKTLECKNCWIPFSLSLIAAGVNLIALQQLGSKYIDTLAEQDSIHDKIYTLDSRGSNPLPAGGIQNSKRKFTFRLCMFFLVAFSGIMLSSCWVKIC